MESRKMVQTYLQSRNRNTDVENKLTVTKGGSGGGMNWEIGSDIYTLLILCIKQITNQNLLYSTGNYTQYLVIIYKGKESGKEYIHIYIKLNQFCTLETNTTL